MDAMARERVGHEATGLETLQKGPAAPARWARHGW